MEDGYVVFVFDLLYPGGGWRDFVGHFDTLATAESAVGDALTRRLGDYYQIISEETDKIVKEGSCPAHSTSGI